MTQDRLGMPSRCTVQAPQSATPQPNLVPFMPSRSRKTHSRAMSGSASTLCDLPLIFRAIIALPPVPHSCGSPSREIHSRTYVGQRSSFGALPLAFVQEADDLDADHGDFLKVQGGA